MRAARLAAACLLLISGCAAPSSAGDGPPLLRPVRTIALPGVEGRFDHFASDAKGHRLFAAALGNNTLESIDTAEGKRAGTVKDLHKPTGVAFVPESGRVVVAGGDDGTVRFYDAASLKPGMKLDGLDDADNVRYDAAAERLYVGYGGGALAVIDARDGKRVGDVKLAAHPESFQLEKAGKRLFVNVPEAGHVAVVDREKGAAIAEWPVTGAKANFPMALDEHNGRLFIACRQPARLLVMETDGGKVVASVPCAGDADDLFYDAERHRLYVSGGEGVVSVIEQRSADQYVAAGSVPTAPGARTSFFVPETGRLYVAVPHRGTQSAELREFEVPHN